MDWYERNSYFYDMGVFVVLFVIVLHSIGSWAIHRKLCSKAQYFYFTLLTVYLIFIKLKDHFSLSLRTKVSIVLMIAAVLWLIASTIISYLIKRHKFRNTSQPFAKPVGKLENML